MWTARSSSRARRRAASSRADFTAESNCSAAAGCLLRRPLEGLHLPALDVDEAGLDPAHDVGLLAVDALGELAFAGLQPLAHLLECASPFGAVRVELGAELRRRELRCPLELFPELLDRGHLKLSGLVDLLAVVLEPGLRLPDEHFLALGELLQLARQRLVRPVEVGAPARIALLHPLLRLCELHVQLRAGLAFALEDVPASLLGDLPLLLLEAGQGVGPLPGEHALDLGAARLGLLADDPRQLVSGAVELGLDVGDPLRLLPSAGEEAHRLTIVGRAAQTRA
jgi:hypothetical protein